jgi:hypothetical protein
MFMVATNKELAVVNVKNGSLGYKHTYLLQIQRWKMPERQVGVQLSCWLTIQLLVFLCAFCRKSMSFATRAELLREL